MTTPHLDPRTPGLTPRGPWRGSVRNPVPTGRSDSAYRVLDAALELFTRSGYDGTSLQQIADRLEVTKAAVYHHFRTKDEILTALVQPAFAELAELLDDERDSRVSGRRGRGLPDLVDCLLRHRQVATFLSRDVAALSHPALWTTAQTLGGRLQVLITGQAPDLDDPLGAFYSGATLAALGTAILTVPDQPEQWLRGELIELGRHMMAGYRKAQRRAAATPPAPRPQRESVDREVTGSG